MKVSQEKMQAVADRLEEMLDGVHVEPVEVQKNNEAIQGFLFRAEGESVSPNIYPTESGLEAIEAGNIDKAVVELLEAYKDAPSADLNNNEVCDAIRNFDRVADALCVRLAPIKNNEAYLKGKPYKLFLDDLAALVYVDLGSVLGAGSHKFTVTVDLNITMMWEKDFDEVYSVALENMREQVDAKRLVDIMADRMGDEIRDYYDPFMCQFMVYSTKDVSLGAGVLPVILDELKEKFERFVILPSSVHEVIVFPVDLEHEADTEELNNMVNFANADAVELVDRLSDHAYYWNGNSFEF